MDTRNGTILAKIRNPVTIIFNRQNKKSSFNLILIGIGLGILILAILIFTLIKVRSHRNSSRNR